MTRFEEACQSEFNMALAVAFCIAGFLEQYDDFTFDDDELTEFLEKIYPDIEEWLKEETETGRRMRNDR